MKAGMIVRYAILAGLLLLGWLRWERIGGIVAGGAADEWIALLTWLVALVLLPAPELARRRAGRRKGLFVARFRQNRLALGGIAAMVLLYLVALLTPILAPYPPEEQNLEEGRFLSPSKGHLLGTDKYGRDILSRILYGARISLSIGFVSVAISLTIGATVGAVAGYFPGAVDQVLMRFVDVLISFPRLVLLLAIIALFSPSIFLLVAVLGLTGWMGTARIVRGEVLSLREREFVLAARALGYRAPRIIFLHILPNVMAPIIVAATLNIGNTVMLEASLSFLGLGVQPPTASWGTMVSAGREALGEAWWISTFPGLAILLTVVSFNLVGDGLGDALDPRK